MDTILARLCQIEVELSDLYYNNQHGSFDMDGNQRRNLSEEYVFLSRKLREANANPTDTDQSLLRRRYVT